MHSFMERPPPPSPPPLDEARIQDDRANVREPFFHGREAEFEIFQRSAKNLALGNLGDRTLVYQGPPGAGKSALMEEIIATVRHHAWATGEPWIAVNVMPGELADSARVAQRVIETFISERVPEASMGSKLRKFRDKITLRVTLAGSIEFSQKNTTSLPSTLENNLNGIVGHIGSTRVVLCVDEASNMCHAKGDPDAKATQAMLERLHMPPKSGATQWQVLPIFFGLSDTTDVLAELKLSRLSNRHIATLARLEDSDANAILDDMCTAYDIELDPSDIERLIEAGQGWPQHLKIITTALLDRVSKTGRSLAKEDMSEIFANIEEFKSGYYATIREKVHADLGALRLIAEQCEQHGVITEGGIRIALETCKGPVNYFKFLSEAKRCGFLAPDNVGNYVIPVPSLQKYILEIPNKDQVRDMGR